MKISIISFLLGFASICFGQNIIVLDQPQSGNKTHVARQKIKLRNGHQYSASNNAKLHLFIDENQMNNDVDSENSLYTSGDFDQPINTELAVGSTPGKADVNGAGASTYSIPIVIPVGTRGMVPNLTINYTSQGGDGHLGNGWNLGSLSAISRAPKSLHHDGKVEGVNHDANDEFSLDGVRLIRTSGTQGQDGSVYQPEVENFSRVTAQGTTASGPSWFLVETKDGLKMECGKTNSSKFKRENSSEVMMWRVNKIYDCLGNYVEFKYLNTHQDSRIDEIKFTGNSTSNLQPYNTIKFYYDTRTHVNETYIAGTVVRNKFLLSDIKITGEGGRIFKNYEFKYAKNDLKVFLQEVVEHGSEGKELNATRFLYYDFDPSDIDDQVSSILSGVDTDIYSADFDGDGKSDILSATFDFTPENIKHHTSLKVHLRNTLNFNASSTTIPISQDFNTVNDIDIPNPKAFFAQDYDGDGQDDILVSEISASDLDLYKVEKFKIHFPTPGAGSFIQNTFNWIAPATNPGRFFESEDNYMTSGDFDGDGRKDFVAFYQYDHEIDFFPTVSITSYKEEARICFPGPGFGTPPRLHLKDENGTLHGIDAEFIERWANAEVLTPIDFDGDGKDEVMIVGDAGSEDKTKIYRFGKTSSGVHFVEEVYSSNIFYTHYDLRFGDFNGDRKTDILAGSSSGNWSICYSTGTYFHIESFDFESTIDLTWNSQHDLVIGDYNGDGKSDILHTFRDPDVNQNRPLFFDFYYSRGKSFFHFNHVEPFNHSAANTGRDVAGDYNGDGRTDILIRNGQGGHMLTYFFNEADNANLLYKVDNGLEQITTFEYQLMTRGSVYTKGLYSTYPFMDIKMPIYLTEKMKVPDGIGGTNTTNFSYEKARIHQRGRGFMGFEKLTRETPILNTRMVSTSELNTTYATLALKKLTVYRFSPLMIVSEHIYDNSFVSRGNNRFWRKTNSVVAYDFVRDFTTTTNSIYDTNGNMTSQTVDDGVETTTVSYSSFTAGCAWMPNQALIINTVRTRPGVPNYQFQTRRYVNSNGLLYKEVAFNGLPKAATTDYSNFDIYGNARTVSISANGESTRTATFVFDDKGRYPETITNPLNQSRFVEYDPLWGKPIKTTSVDGLETTYDYDGYGALRKTVSPEGNCIAINWGWDVQNGPGTGTTDVQNAAFFRHMIIPGKPEEKVWYDRFSRERKREVKSFNNDWNKLVTSYDARGNIRTVSTPFTNAASAVVTTNVYDNLNRLYSFTNDIGTTTFTRASDDGETTITRTNTAGQTTTSTKDASGRIIKTTDSAGEVTKTYFAHGGLKDVKVNGQQTVAMTYDPYGRQTVLNDVSGGITNRTFNAFGQLVFQKDAKNNEHSYHYDQLGRMDYEEMEEGIIDYQYVTSGYGLNKLKKVIGFNGITKEYTYDNLSRIGGEVEVVDGTSFFTTYAYDRYSNIIKRTFPSGYEINKIYNSRGYLDQIKDNSNVTLFNASKMNAFDQYTEYTLGNGKTSEMTYDQYGLPENYYTPGIQDLSFTFNIQTGNLENRHDFLKNKVETFTYDNLNRLKNSTVSGQTPIDLNYVNSGNISTKTDAGLYFYGGTYATLDAIYAQNAAITGISTTQQDIVYDNSFDQPDQITEGNWQVDYTYGVNLNRKKSVWKENGTIDKTIYYFGAYERIIENGVTKHLHYLTEGDGLNAIMVRTNGQNSYYYTYQDYLGSILTVTDAQGAIVHEQNFDAWGRQRNVNTWNYTNVATSPDWLIRGYTGHEHLRQFDLINMNGRMYDPVVGRMLSVDNNIPFPGSTQGYNRYSYALNNPLKYTDPDGEWIHIVAGALIGGFFNGIVHADEGIGGFFKGFAIGAAAGAVTAATGGLAAGASSIGQGILIGAASGVGGDILLQVGNNVVFNDPFSPKQALIAGALGGIGGGFAAKSGLAKATKPDLKVAPSSSPKPTPTTTGGFNSTASGGGEIVKVGDAVDDFAFSVSLTNEVVVTAAKKGASSGGKYAFGTSYERIVHRFADRIGAKHLMDAKQWRQRFMEVISNPENEIHFILDGIDDTPMNMILKPGVSNTNWELSMLYQNKPAFEKTIFYFGDKTYLGFDILQIKP